MISLVKGRYTARLARGTKDIEMAQTLRGRAFGRQSDGRWLDKDPFDARCDHVLIEDHQSGRLVCCFRFLPLASGAEINSCYSAQFYDLKRLAAFNQPMVEMGRFCVDTTVSDPDILRIAWAAMTDYVDRNGVELLFGCASFSGTDPKVYSDAFDLLNSRYLVPDHWRPEVKSPDVVSLARPMPAVADSRQGLLRMPPMLRTYLMMGGWVSDHAVIDHDMGTLHVFTGVEIALIPPARKRLLRAVVG